MANRITPKPPSEREVAAFGRRRELIKSRDDRMTSQQVARNTSLAVGEQAPHGFATTRFAPMHKFHLANRTSLLARVLGVSLIARRT